YVGSKTGRDGIHGATMASAEFDDEAEAKRPTVQVGDPFTEKLLIEACLELMAEDVIIGIQDMGAAGLTSSSFEMAGKGGVGVEIDLDRVPVREKGMTAYEMMLSESQERMLMVLRPGSEPSAEAIFRKWELDFAVIGETTETGRLEIMHQGALKADIPIPALADEAPEYERPYQLRKPPAVIAADEVPAPNSDSEALLKLMGSPHLCSRRWIWEQYDHMVMGDTVQRPGGDAAVVRIHGTNKGLATTCDVTPRYCQADPFEGGKQAIAEAWRNLTAVGADPLAVTDCLNFGNPERPEIMGEFVGCIQGMAKACRAFAFPVVSGNVSLYNETNGVAIPPTPGIGAIGLIPQLGELARIAVNSDQILLMLGEINGHLGQSLYQELATGSFNGAPPPVDLNAEKQAGDFVRSVIRDGLCSTVHDISDGGLLVALAEMALAGGTGLTITETSADLPPHAYYFGEEQGRYLLAVSPDNANIIRERAANAGLPLIEVARSGGDAIRLPDEPPLPLATLESAHEAWFPHYFGER
ncbi:MAG TPA: phosphoribosylformylglycinamidine synthase subunit PurL, partial [Hyphomicrobiales bacterium]|nr:phosphoribosylformylglycinamidine synthase subunit PurL [Hyphomicrobiales bacterium]